MAFLDNSGDIILDAVLTDTGRYRLAKGDGSFKIVKFALGDDEIDYSLYDKANPSGSVYYDLNILQTPVLEAFTDNFSALKSRLLTINQTDLLFLPVIKINDKTQFTFDNLGFFAVAVDDTTENQSLFTGSTGGVKKGVFFTAKPASTKDNNIQLDQGLDTPQISPMQSLSPDLVETAYMVEIDNRLGFLKNEADGVMTPSYIDDDQIATYYITAQNTTSKTVESIVTNNSDENISSIRGPRGTRLTFKLAASLELQSSTFLFEQLGNTDSGFNIINTTIRVTGATTGYRIDIPVRFYKKT